MPWPITATRRSSPRSQAHRQPIKIACVKTRRCGCGSKAKRNRRTWGSASMRKFVVIDADQRSPEWFAARLGRLTGSRAVDMLATIKSGEAAARRDLRMQLVCERLTSVLQEEAFVNAAMQRGIDCEPLARDLYERQTGCFMQATGFLAHTEYMAGCSLDGHVGEFEGIVELKCPKSATHLKYLRAG